MTTPKKIAANRQNALRSTGPRTPGGKHIVSQNPVRHGAYSPNPAIPGLEQPDSWHQHLQSTLNSLAPVGQVEHDLAERVAVILWRLRRIARFERGVTHAARARTVADVTKANRPFLELPGVDTIDKALARLAQARATHRAFQRLTTGAPDTPLSGRHAADIIAALDAQLPDLDLDDFACPALVPDGVAWSDISGWTVDRLRRLIDAIAEEAGREPGPLVEAAATRARDILNKERAAHRSFHRAVRDLRGERILPEPTSMDRLVRYENHLTRQLSQTLTQLRALQHTRHIAPASDAFDPIPPPADPAPIPLLPTLPLDTTA